MTIQNPEEEFSLSDQTQLEQLYKRYKKYLNRKLYLNLLWISAVFCAFSISICISEQKVSLLNINNFKRSDTFKP